MVVQDVRRSNDFYRDIDLHGNDILNAGGLGTEEPIIIDVTDPEALLVRRDGDTGDVLVVDTTNIRVGIGTAAPSVELEVNGIILSNNLNASGYFTAVGELAGVDYTGDEPTMVGGEAGYNSTGNYTVYVGAYAGWEAIGDQNTFVGYDSGDGTVGSYITSLGSEAGTAATLNYGTFLGYYAGTSSTGSNSIGIGFEALRTNSGNDVVAIGDQAGEGNALDNQFILIQTRINATPLIQGDFSTGNVAIGKASAGSKLGVLGLPIFANNAAAIAGALAAGDFYRTNADPDPVCVVH